MIHSKRYLCTTAVWGREYTNLFVGITLPALLAEGNLSAIAAAARFQIYAKPEDIEWMLSTDSIKYLKDIMPVTFHAITHIPKLHYPFTTMTDCHRRAIYEADKNDEVIVFFSPDCVFSKGSIQKAKNLIEDGFSVIALAGLRLALETTIPVLTNYLEKNKPVLSISSRELVKIALDNLHPIMLKFLWNDMKYDSIVPGNLLWKIADQGLLERCFYLHPLMIHSEKKHAICKFAIDQDYVANACPDTKKHYIITNSDEMAMFELTTLARNVDGIPHQDRDVLMNDVTHFFRQYSDYVHRENAKHYVCLHTGNYEGEAWSTAKKESDEILNQIFSGLNIQYDSSKTNNMHSEIVESANVAQ